MIYPDVRSYLESQRSGRPQTFKEISLSTNRSAIAIMRELNGLQLRGIVKVVTVRFNNKSVPFYTVRQDVIVEAVQEGKPERWKI